MYFVKYGDKYLHDPRVCLILPLTQPSVELNTSTEFKFQLPYGHELYDTIRERDPDNPVIVYQDSIVIYKGEIIDISLDFEFNKEVTCKSDLGYLNQIPTRPYSTSSEECTRTCPTTLRGYFEFLINEYNEQASNARKFKMGINQGANLDSSFDNYYSDSSYTSVGSTIKENIIEDVGGYVRTRYDEEVTYIDLLSDMPDVNAQVIDFGKNLLDFAKDDNSDEVYSFVIPLGKQVEKESADSEELALSLPISSVAVTYLQREVTSTLEAKNEAQEAYDEAVAGGDPEAIAAALERLEEATEAYNDAVSAKTDADTATIDRTIEDGYKKSGDLIYSEKAVSRYGWIGTTADFSDVGLVSSLISYGLIYLKSVESPVTTIECTALDLSMINPDLKPIKLGDYIRVRSKPHGIDSYYLVSKIDYDLNDPSNNTFTLGTTFDTLTGQQNKRINTLNKTINTVYEAADKLSAETKAAAIVAGAAQVTAEEAQTTAATAQSTATSAQSTATTAQSTATEAQTTATTAQSTATAAQTAANNVETELTQTSEEIRTDFESSISATASDLQAQIQAGDALATTKFSEINRYIRFVDGSIILGETGNDLMLTLVNDRVSFTQGGVEVAYFSNNNLYIKRAEVLTTLKVGNYEFAPRNDGGLALKKRSD